MYETTADVIRRMTDGQLFDFLDAFKMGDIDYAITFCDMCKEGGNIAHFDCDDCLKYWLASPAKGVFGLLYYGEVQ